jgi:hypothetical protein
MIACAALAMCMSITIWHARRFSLPAIDKITDEDRNTFWMGISPISADIAHADQKTLEGRGMAMYVADHIIAWRNADSLQAIAHM